MELTKRSERIKGTGRIITHSIPAIGGRVIKLNRYEKWTKVYAGRLLDKMDFYEIIMPDGKKGWALIDILGQVACPIQTDKDEVIEFLRTEGWSIKTQVEDEDEEEEE